MIIAEIGRGLGNSMFVYAAALALAKHKKTPLKLDISYLDSWPRWEKYGGLWEFELGRFNISAAIATKKEVRKHIARTKFRPIDKIILKYRLFEKSVVRFPSSGSVKDFFALSDNIYLRGYLGREKFFKPVKNQISKEFTLKEQYKKEIKDLLEKVKKTNSVSIHVRRGDLLTIGAHTLDINYYKQAVEIIKGKVKNPVFYVFSDEISWCKKNLKLGIKLNFVEDYKSYQDFELMRSCKNNILANSALSWWAGYVNQNKKKIVVCPKEFTHFIGLEKDIKDKIVDGWISIS